MPQLFSYGTLQLPSVQLSSFNRLLTGTADTLPNYTLGTLEITDPQVLAISNQQQHLRPSHHQETVSQEWYLN